MSKTEMISMTQFLPCTPARVWKALTDPTLHAKWWVAGDIRATVGQKFFLDMGPWGAQSCEVIAVVVEKLFSYRFGKDTLHTIITWQLQAQDGGTLLTLEHSGFDINTAMGKVALHGMEMGWPQVLAKLHDVLLQQDH